MSWKCRICSGYDSEEIISFGNVALANSFLASKDWIDKEKKYPLTLVLCLSCHHLQIKEVLDPSLLFSNFPWHTGVPASIGKYCTEFVESVLAKCSHQASNVFEIASNDGTMLRAFAAHGLDILGVDPARNVVEEAQNAGIPSIADFFCESLAATILSRYGKQDIIIARNVLAHVADLHGLVCGIRLLLSDTGIAVIEVPHLLTTYRHLQYDQIFHEHIGYHSLDSIVNLFSMHKLCVWDVEQPWIHGGSLRVYVCHETKQQPRSEEVERVLNEERDAGIFDVKAWHDFAARVFKQKELLRRELHRLNSEGKTVIAYGASGKAQTMLQFCDLDSNIIRYVVDKSADKIGKLTPGSHIPIVAPETMRNDHVYTMLLLAWNFVDEILAQESVLISNGLRVLVPIPEPHYK